MSSISSVVLTKLINKYLHDPLLSSMSTIIFEDPFSTSHNPKNNKENTINNYKVMNAKRLKRNHNFPRENLINSWCQGISIILGFLHNDSCRISR